MKHIFYKTSDHDAPSAIKDSNGDVVLQMCRYCHKAEGEIKSDDEECPVLLERQATRKLQMTNEEMIELANQIKSATKRLEAKNSKQDDMKEVGEVIVPATFMLVEVACDIKRIANSLEMIKKGIVILVDIQAQTYQNGVKISRD